MREDQFLTTIIVALCIGVAAGVAFELMAAVLMACIILLLCALFVRQIER